jgi:GNAT superfamily N-acetyltransferase
MMEGWAVRFANGYSSRANSASAIVTGARLSEALLAQTEGLYRQQGLKPRVRLTPVADMSCENLLRQRGYRQLDESMTMLLGLTSHVPATDARVVLAERPEPDWLQGISQRRQGEKRSAQHLQAIVSRIALPAAFARLAEAGEDIGFGLCVVDGELAELGSIMIDAEHRGRGLGEALVRSLLAFASEQGARLAFLQVDCANAAAIRLYGRLGFASLYRYNTWILD